MNILESIAVFTENRVNKRREKKRLKKEQKRTFWGEVKEWLSAFLFAIVVVSLFNMWGCQQYIVPTGSMEPTVLGGDRLFVNKRAYGTEIYSYGPKRSDKTPERGDIITFYNPEYKSSGAFIESVRDLIFLGTFTLVNLNKDKNGNPLEKMFIKRAIGLPGDRVKFINGDVYIKRFGDVKYQKEESVSKAKNYTPYRSVKKSDYDFIRAYSELVAYDELSKKAPTYLESAVRGKGIPTSFDYFDGTYELDKVHFENNPSDKELLTSLTASHYGPYIGERQVLPLGDNRDGSHDGRFFGPVGNSKINGRATFIAFPPKRVKKL